MNRALTETLLRDLCAKGMTDASIGSLYKMTGEGIAYRRKKYGLSKPNKVDELTETSVETLSSDYHHLTYSGFSRKYGFSKSVWLPLLRQRGVILKSELRKRSYVFSQDQRNLIIGSLLGDGSVSQGMFFYEGHSRKQTQYLYKKHGLLKPLSHDVYPVDNDTGLRFKTDHNRAFLEFYNQFYSEGISGKQIPLDFLKSNWHDHVLAYWFLDDGHYSDVSNELFIANKAPYEQLVSFSGFLEEHYSWGFEQLNQNL